MPVCGSDWKSRVEGAFTIKARMAIAMIDSSENAISGSITTIIIWPTAYEKCMRGMRAFVGKTLRVMKSDSIIHGTESDARA